MHVVVGDVRDEGRERVGVCCGRADGLPRASARVVRDEVDADATAEGFMLENVSVNGDGHLSADTHLSFPAQSGATAWRSSSMIGMPVGNPVRFLRSGGRAVHEASATWPRLAIDPT